MKLLKREIKDLVIAWVTISLAFAILFSGGVNLFSSLTGFLIALAVSGTTVGIGFLLHEIMHKAIAERYGITSEFKAFYGMLFFAVIFSFFGFIIAAPGAVEIKKRRLSKEEAGKISLAGPATNIAIGLVFLTLFFIFMPSGLLRTVFIMGLTINALLAVFNLIPFAMFDGKKVYRWNRTVYYVTLGFSLALLSSIFLV